MGYAPSIAGHVLGRLTVIRETAETRSPSGRRCRHWICRCTCGTEVVVSQDRLRQQKTVSCGCYAVEVNRARRRPDRIVVPGMTFGKLTVTECIVGGRKARARCLCSCGNETVVEIANLLATRGTRSCGCLWRKHGEHEGTPEYRAWHGIITRCGNRNQPSWPRYGGRGITVCDEWRASYPAFLAAVGRRPSPDHTIDRINNDGNYEPGNVRWATMREQSRNRRNNRRLTVNGKTLLLVEWSEVVGVDVNTIHARLRAGWSDERSVLAPVRRQRAAA